MMIDAAPSYRCKVSEGNSRGTFHLGRKRYRVSVVEMSRDSFTVRVPSSIARKISMGGKYKLLYQEMLWSVGCSNKWPGEANFVDVEFQQLDELTPPKLRSAPLSGNTNSVSVAGQADPTLPLALLAAFIVVVLIAPAWGGQWGTSDRLCAAVSSTWTALVELVTGKR